jgi:hypothetical protein
MKYSNIKTTKDQLADIGINSWRKVIDHAVDGDDDFTVDDYRIISEDSIDHILVDELSNDEYMLGCFASWAIADATGWPVSLIEAAQKGEQYDEIGDGMTNEHVEKLAQILVSNDGYGHHFSSYDGKTNEFTVDGKTFYAFRN